MLNRCPGSCFITSRKGIEKVTAASPSSGRTHTMTPKTTSSPRLIHGEGAKKNAAQSTANTSTRTRSPGASNQARVLGHHRAQGAVKT